MSKATPERIYEIASEICDYYLDQDEVSDSDEDWFNDYLILRLEEVGWTLEEYDLLMQNDDQSQLFNHLDEKYKTPVSGGAMFEYQELIGVDLDRINHAAQEGWKVISSSHSSSVVPIYDPDPRQCGQRLVTSWTVLMERQQQTK